MVLACLDIEKERERRSKSLLFFVIITDMIRCNSLMKKRKRINLWLQKWVRNNKMYPLGKRERIRRWWWEELAWQKRRWWWLIINPKKSDRWIYQWEAKTNHQSRFILLCCDVSCCVSVSSEKLTAVAVPWWYIQSNSGMKCQILFSYINIGYFFMKNWLKNQFFNLLEHWL